MTCYKYIEGSHDDNNESNLCAWTVGYRECQVGLGHRTTVRSAKSGRVLACVDLAYSLS